MQAKKEKVAIIGSGNWGSAIAKIIGRNVLERDEFENEVTTQQNAILTEEEAIEYLIQKDVPQSVWQSWDEGNRPKMVICRKEQLPGTREWRNAWRISDELAA